MQKKLTILPILLILAVIATYFYSKRDYVDGNILHLPIMARNTENNAIPSPWSQAGMISGFMYRTLLIADSSLLEFKPDLANSYEILDHGLRFKISLKQGQKWSDGAPITPQDVIFSVESFLQAKDVNLNPIAVKAFRKIKNMQIEGNNIIFDLWEPHYNFLPALAQFTIMPKHALENTDMAEFHTDSFWANPVVSGMYKLDSMEKDAYFTLVVNEHYAPAKPKIAEIRLHMFNSPAQVDMYYTNNISEMIHYRSMKNYEEHLIEMLFLRYFVFSVQGNDGYINPKMQDKRVREAICLAIDNEGLVNRIYFEVGASTSSIADSENFYNYDPEKAKELLAEAKYNFAEPLKLAYYYNDTTSHDVMNYLKRNLEDVGFKVELIQAGNELDKLYTNRKYDVLFKGLASFNDLEWYEEYDSFHPFLVNIMDTKEDFDDLIQEATTTVDPELHKTVLQKLQDLDREYLFKFPIYSPMQLMYINTNRVQLPKGLKFANPWYISALDIANWQIKKK